MRDRISSIRNSVEGLARRVKTNSCPLTPCPSPAGRGENAFTLAEVLITLVIIGVIAAITVPTLMNKIRNDDLVQKFKKSYSVLAQAFALAQAENGPLDTWDWSSMESGHNNVKNYIIPKMQVQKKCYEIGSGNCITWAWNKIDGSSWQIPSQNNHEIQFILNDGMAFSVNVRANCIENRTQCLDIHLDTNGKKGPNRRGRDLFSFYAYPFTNDIKPGGTRPSSSAVTYDPAKKQWSSNSKEYIIENCDSNGFACGARIIMDGYKMEY